MTTARRVVKEKRLLAVLHLFDEIDAVVHPVLVEVLGVGKIDQFDVIALFRVGGSAVNLIMIERSLFHHPEAGRAQRYLGIEILVAPLRVLVRHADKAEIIIVSDVLRQRATVLAHVPFARTARHVTELL
jgi:hypothetical protein